MTREERLIGGYSGRMLFVLSLTWAAIQVARYVLPPLLPEIRADLSLSLAQAGVVLTVLQAVTATFQYPGGRLSDSWSRATLLVPACGILLVGLVLIAGATGPLILLLGVGVFGVGRGLYASPARAQVSDLFVERRGRALGVIAAGSDVGGLVASGAAVAVIALATWRAVFLPLALVVGVLLVAFVLLNEEPYTLTRTDLDLFGTGRRILATSRQRQTILAFALFFFMLNGVLNFLPEFLRQVKGFSPALAGIGFSFLFAPGLVAKPAAGALSDRVSRELVAIAAMLLTMVALVALVVVESVVGIIGAIILFAVCYKSQFPVVDAILMDAAPDDNMGGDLGAARAIFFGGGSLGPAVVGYVAGRYDFTVAFAMLVGLLVVALLLLAKHGR